MTKQEIEALMQKRKLDHFREWIDGIYENNNAFYRSMTYDDMFIFYNAQCIADGKKSLMIEPSEMNYIIRQALYTK